MQIQNEIINLKATVTNHRRELHKIPEQGNMEFKTTEYIFNRLKQLGMTVHKLEQGTGVIAFLEGKEKQRTIAYRADIDALSVDEQSGLEFCSLHKGYMHACGHDGHMAALLGFAELMSSQKPVLDKSILFIFQPAEEGPGGAKPIVDAGILEKYHVEAVFGLHIYPDIPEGKVGCRPGAMMAQTGEFDIRIKGKSAHGAMPHKGTDALVAGANMLMALNTVVSRNVDPLEPAVLTVGRFYGGERRNIIAGEAVLEGTVRAFNNETYQRIRQRLLTVIQHVPAAYECETETEIEIRDMYPAVTNDEKLYELFKGLIPEEDFMQLKPMTISEDFSYYQQKVPGVFFMLGSRNEEKDMVYSLHNNRFNFNEEILLKGIQIFHNIYKSL